MAKKHQSTKTNNGKTYSYYRKNLIVNGKTRTITAANVKERVEEAGADKKEVLDA